MISVNKLVWHICSSNSSSNATHTWLCMHIKFIHKEMPPTSLTQWTGLVDWHGMAPHVSWQQRSHWLYVHFSSQCKCFHHRLKALQSVHHCSYHCSLHISHCIHTYTIVYPCIQWLMCAHTYISYIYSISVYECMYVCMYMLHMHMRVCFRLWWWTWCF